MRTVTQKNPYLTKDNRNTILVQRGFSDSIVLQPETNT